MTNREVERRGDPANQPATPVETASGGVPVRSSEEILRALMVISGLPHEGDNSDAEFMRGQIAGLDSFVTIDQGWVVLKSGIDLRELATEYADLRRLQRGGHLIGSLTIQGRLTGLGWGLNRRQHLLQRVKGGHRVVKL